MSSLATWSGCVSFGSVYLWGIFYTPFLCWLTQQYGGLRNPSTSVTCGQQLTVWVHVDGQPLTHDLGEYEHSDADMVATATAEAAEVAGIVDVADAEYVIDTVDVEDVIDAVDAEDIVDAAEAAAEVQALAVLVV